MVFSWSYVQTYNWVDLRINNIYKHIVRSQSMIGHSNSSVIMIGHNNSSVIWLSIVLNLALGFSIVSVRMGVIQLLYW
jgi:hypothetical protein